ncbi:MAG: DMT family transporter [Chloroflexota bacterium]
MNNARIVAIAQALLAALLFGASAPLAKLLLGNVEPVMLAALLYLGSGLGVLLVKVFQRLENKTVEDETRIKRADWKWLAGAVIAGGVAAPIILLFSLRQTPASTASLLLNFESVATTFIAVIVFKEGISRRAFWAVTCVTLASILLSLDDSGQWGISLGAIGILGACILWGIDNNFTRNISAKDPLTIVLVKGFGAGSFSLLLALVLQNAIPSVSIIFGALLLGSISYGMSIVLFIRAMRALGAARTSALFGTSPLAGVLLSFLLLREFPSSLFLIALPLIVLALFLLLRERDTATKPT